MFELLDSTANESHYLTLNLLMRIGILVEYCNQSIIKRPMEQRILNRNGEVVEIFFHVMWIYNFVLKMCNYLQP
jgi:hypothetical protein